MVVRVRLGFRSPLLPIGSAYGGGCHGGDYRGFEKENWLRVLLRQVEYHAALEEVFC